MGPVRRPGRESLAYNFIMEDREKIDILRANEAQSARQRLRGSVVRFDRPLDPVIEPEDWEMDR